MCCLPDFLREQRLRYMPPLYQRRSRQTVYTTSHFENPKPRNEGSWAKTIGKPAILSLRQQKQKFSSEFSRETAEVGVALDGHADTVRRPSSRPALADPICRSTVVSVCLEILT